MLSHEKLYVGSFQLDTATQVFSVIRAFLETAENLLHVLSIRHA